MIDFATQRYAVIALVSAALFGVSTPLAKQLVGEVHPVSLAGLLYCGSGLGLVLFMLARKAADAQQPAIRITRREMPWLIVALVSGGVAGPLLLLYGLSGLDASEASLLLNLEAVFTVLLAGLFFGEHVSRRVWIATLVMLTAATALSWRPGQPFEWSTAALAVAGACLAWALDNNVTRHIASADAVSIAMIKGLVPGVANLALAAALGAPFPGPRLIAGALAIGALCYGASLALYITAQRHLGSARTSAHFATAPFIGAAAALLVLPETAGPAFWVALAFMALATGLLLTERHAHWHRHERFEHEHVHVHDEHHRHAHAPEDDSGEPHSHPHVHDPVGHSHPHLPDLHHRHRH